MPGQAQKSATSLLPADFVERIKQLPGAPLVDVRTPDEFAKGHLQNALNYDWNGTAFDTQIAALDKSKPVFVYCLSGGRSGSAAAKMRSQGFTSVYELDGGIIKWRAAGLPETNGNKSGAAGMSKQAFENLLKSDKLVLVDFYAEWCAPCKKMKPYLDEITETMSEKVVVIRINVDDNQSLCKELGIEALPVLQLYRQGGLQWQNSGFTDRETVLEKLKR
jgi:thioredoxin